MYVYDICYIYIYIYTHNNNIYIYISLSMHINIIYIYIYTYTFCYYISLSLSLSLSIYIYIHTHSVCPGAWLGPLRDQHERDALGLTKQTLPRHPKKCAGGSASSGVLNFRGN